MSSAGIEMIDSDMKMIRKVFESDNVNEIIWEGISRGGVTDDLDKALFCNWNDCKCFCDNWHMSDKVNKNKIIYINWRNKKWKLLMKNC